MIGRRIGRGSYTIGKEKRQRGIIALTKGERSKLALRDVAIEKSASEG